MGPRGDVAPGALSGAGSELSAAAAPSMPFRDVVGASLILAQVFVRKLI